MTVLDPGIDTSIEMGHPATRVPALPVLRRHRWQVIHVSAVALMDVVALLSSGSIALALRFGSTSDADVDGYWVPLLLSTLLWLSIVSASGAYNLHVVGTGTDEYRRTLDAGLRFGAAVVIVTYALHSVIPRSVLLVWLPLNCAIALVLRRLARGQLARARESGRAMRRVLVLGHETSAFALAARLAAAPAQGFLVIGVCASGGSDRRQQESARAESDRRRHPHQPGIVGGIDDVARLVRDLRADVIALAPGSAVSGQRLRELVWDLEDTGAELLVAPGLVDVAGPRLRLSPVDGQPLLHVQTPRLRGYRSLVKTTFDRVTAVVGLACLLPALALIALAIKLDSPGSVLFRQTRVGRGGTPFTLYKLRTMRPGAELELLSLADQNSHRNGPLFKMAQDPRVTRMGRHLRRWSIDEVPQLVNVALGQMSLVGPRPPLPAEVARYTHRDVHRRLMVRPGLTGLWQVSGRADLAWNEAIRLDLYYVENWSLTFDISIMCKTVGAVARGRGAR